MSKENNIRDLLSKTRKLKLSKTRKLKLNENLDILQQKLQKDNFGETLELDNNAQVTISGNIGKAIIDKKKNDIRDFLNELVKNIVDEIQKVLIQLNTDGVVINLILGTPNEQYKVILSSVKENVEVTTDGYIILTDESIKTFYALNQFFSSNVKQRMNSLIKL